MHPVCTLYAPVCCLNARLVSAPLATLQIEQLNRYQFLTAKPMVYLANLSSADYIRKKNKWLGPIAEWVQPPPSSPAPVVLPVLLPAL